MNQAQALVVVAAELGLFLRPGRRGGPVRVALDGTSSLGHLVESLGVPLTEAGRLLVDGDPALPGYRPGSGDVVGVDPVRRPQHLEPARFVLDVHLGTLARRLRLVGVDTAYANDADDDALIEQANASRRVLLTQDRGLLCRRKLRLGAYVRGARPDDQFADVLDRSAPPAMPPGAARLSWRRTRWEDQDAMSTDVTVILEHRPGELARLGEITGEAGVSIRGLAAFTGEGRGVVHVLLDDEAVARCRAALQRAGIGIADTREVLVVEVEDRPMALGEVTRRLADANVNVELAYTTFGGVKIVIATDDLKSARAVLQQT